MTTHNPHSPHLPKPTHPIHPATQRTARTCMQLGVCQGAPSCEEHCLRHPFAPGVIDHSAPPAFNWAGLVEAALVMAALCAAVGLTLGLAAGGGSL